MKIIPIATLLGLLGATSLSLNAAELKVVNSIQGRAGIHTMVRVETEKPTIALSRQDKGVGNARTERNDAERNEERSPKAYWHNPSRPTINVTAHN